VTALERELVALGTAIEYPPTPNLAPRVRARLEERRAPFGFPLRRALATGFVVLLVTAGALMAVPTTRSAILDLLGLAGVTIERVETLPEVRPGAGLDLGEAVSLEEAERRAGHDVRVPAELGSPDAVYVRREVPLEIVSLVYGVGGEEEFVLTQFRGGIRDVVVKKVVEPGTTVVPITLAGQPGFWIEGAPHFVAWVDEEGMVRDDEVALAGNVLLWQDRGLTLRLEGARTLRQALAIASSVD
jgi:hypothetical protein